MKLYLRVRAFLLSLLVTGGALGTLPALALVGSNITNGFTLTNMQFVFYGAAPPSAGGPMENMCLDIPYGDVHPGALPGAYWCNGTSAQTYQVYDTIFTGEDGVAFRAYSISPQSNGTLCLDVQNANYNAGIVQLYQCNRTAAQAWLIGNQLVSAGAWHSPGSNYSLGLKYFYQNTGRWYPGVACLAPTMVNGGNISLQMCAPYASPAAQQRQTIVPTTTKLALYSNGFSDFLDQSQDACLNFQTWGSANATLNTQACIPQQTSLNVLNSVAAVSTAALPSTTERFSFRPIIGGSGVTLTPLNSPNTPLTWTGDINNPMAYFPTAASNFGQPGAGGAAWWLLGYNLTHSAVVSMYQPGGTYECLGGSDIYDPIGNAVNVAINLVPCATQNGTGLTPTQATSFDISGMWK